MRVTTHAIGIAGIVFLIFAFTSSNALAGTRTTASAALMEGNMVEAIQMCMRLAMDNDVHGQVCLGTLYANGIGVTRDDAKAALWYRKAADQGLATAQNNLGRLYDAGRGVPKDYGLAAQWFRKAADQGYAMAQENLGFLYELGAGVHQDYKQAASWYRKAADQGLTLAQINLGRLYENGRGLSRNYDLAAQWYQRAAAQWNPLGMSDLAKLYSQGRGVRQNPIMAYALYNVAATIDLLPNNAARHRDLLAAHMTKVQTLQARQLSMEMLVPKNYESVYRRYLNNQ